jgi:hypothetical protein
MYPSVTRCLRATTQTDLSAVAEDGGLGLPADRLALSQSGTFGRVCCLMLVL